MARPRTAQSLERQPRKLHLVLRANDSKATGPSAASHMKPGTPGSNGPAQVMSFEKTATVNGSPSSAVLTNDMSESGRAATTCVSDVCALAANHSLRAKLNAREYTAVWIAFTFWLTEQARLGKSIHLPNYMRVHLTPKGPIVQLQREYLDRFKLRMKNKVGRENATLTTRNAMEEESMLQAQVSLLRSCEDSLKQQSRNKLTKLVGKARARGKMDDKAFKAKADVMKRDAGEIIDCMVAERRDLQQELDDIRARIGPSASWLDTSGGQGMGANTLEQGQHHGVAWGAVAQMATSVDKGVVEDAVKDMFFIFGKLQTQGKPVELTFPFGRLRARHGSVVFMIRLFSRDQFLDMFRKNTDAPLLDLSALQLRSAALSRPSTAMSVVSTSSHLSSRPGTSYSLGSQRVGGGTGSLLGLEEWDQGGQDAEVRVSRPASRAGLQSSRSKLSDTLREARERSASITPMSSRPSTSAGGRGTKTQHPDWSWIHEGMASISERDLNAEMFKRFEEYEAKLQKSEATALHTQHANAEHQFGGPPEPALKAKARYMVAHGASMTERLRELKLKDPAELAKKREMLASLQKQMAEDEHRRNKSRAQRRWQISDDTKAFPFYPTEGDSEHVRMQLRAERKQCGRNLREEYNRQIEEKAKRVEAERQALLSTETQGIIDNQLAMRQIKEHEENRIKTQKKDNFAAWTAQKNHREFINSLTEGVATRMPL